MHEQHRAKEGHASVAPRAIGLGEGQDSHASFRYDGSGAVVVAGIHVQLSSTKSVPDDKNIQRHTHCNLNICFPNNS